MIQFLYLCFSFGAQFNTSFYTFRKIGGASISDLYLNYQSSKYNYNVVFEKRPQVFGLKSISVGIDSFVKNYNLVIGDRPYYLNCPLSTTLPLWGIVLSSQDMSLFLGKTRDPTSILPLRFTQNNYTFGFKIARNFGYRVPVDFYFFKKNDAYGAVRDNNLLGFNAKVKILENLLMQSQLAMSLGALGLGSGISFSANYTCEKYGASAAFRRIFRGFITPANIISNPDNWFHWNSYVRILEWFSVDQIINYSDFHNFDVGMNFCLNKYPVPEFSYGVVFSRKSEVFTHNFHTGWRYKKLFLTFDHTRSKIYYRSSFKINKITGNFQTWFQLQVSNPEIKIYQLGSLLPFSKNIKVKGFLNLQSQNGHVKTNNGLEFSIKKLNNFDFNITYEIVKSYDVTEHLVSFSLINNLVFNRIGGGFIGGRVFMDVNNNGIFDDEDQVVSDAELILDKKTTVKTDKYGNYQFSFVPAGVHTLCLELGCIPAELGSEKSQVSVNTKFLSRQKVDFPITRLGFIEGKVFYDDNKNGKYDAGEQGVPNVVLALNGYVTTTDKFGDFRFANLLPGTYILEAKVIPPETFLYSSDLVYFYLLPGEGFRDFHIGIVKKERPLKKKIFERIQEIKPHKRKGRTRARPSNLTQEKIENLFRKGVEYFNAQQFDDALKIFNQVLAMNPEHKRALEYKRRTLKRLEVLRK